MCVCVRVLPGLEAGGRDARYLYSFPTPSLHIDFCRDIYSLHLLAAGLPLPTRLSLQF